MTAPTITKAGLRDGRSTGTHGNTHRLWCGRLGWQPFQTLAADIDGALRDYALRQPLKFRQLWLPKRQQYRVNARDALQPIQEIP